jgi:putative heme-binding domain-containing protein
MLLWRDSAVLTTEILSAMTAILDAIEHHGLAVEQFLREISESPHDPTRWLEFESKASRLAENESAPPDLRAAAIFFLARQELKENELSLLCRLCAHGKDAVVRAAARAGLRKQRDPSVAEILLRDWPRTTPMARQEIINLLQAREPWTIKLLTTVRDGGVSAQEITLTDRQRLEQSAQQVVRDLASKVWSSNAFSTRGDIVRRYVASLSLTGDPSRGRVVYSNNCASCHVWSGTGHSVGPDLSTLQDKEADYWIQNILDPNAAVEPRFVAYEVETVDDRMLAGIIKTETPSDLTLVASQGLNSKYDYDTHCCNNRPDRILSKYT